MGDVIELDVITRLDVPVSRVIETASSSNLESVFIAGCDEGGNYFFASSMANGAEAVWLLEMAKKRLLDIADE